MLLIDKPGYDESSGLLLDFKAGDFAPVPISPTKEDALIAAIRNADEKSGLSCNAIAAHDAASS